MISSLISFSFLATLFASLMSLLFSLNWLTILFIRAIIPLLRACNDFCLPFYLSSGFLSDDSPLLLSERSPLMSLLHVSSLSSNYLRNSFSLSRSSLPKLFLRLTMDWEQVTTFPFNFSIYLCRSSKFFFIYEIIAWLFLLSSFNWFFKDLTLKPSNISMFLLIRGLSTESIF